MLNSSELFTTETLVLDDRSIEQRLQNFYDYVRLIPFGTGVGGGKFWSDLFFPQGPDDVQRLADLYRAAIASDGELPPQQAFLLAFLRQMETPRRLLNELPALHRQLYYHDLLGLRQRAAQPDQVALSFSLNSAVGEQLLPAGLALDAGHDSQGLARQYLLDQALQANGGRLSELCWLRRNATQELGCLVQSTDGLAFPAQGVRLFGAHEREQPVRSGRVVASDLLALSDGVREITIAFATSLAAGTLNVTFSSTNGWLQPVELILDNNTSSVLCTVGADQAAITAPNGLDGFQDAVPLLKITRLDGQPVPEVMSLMVSVSATQSSRIVFRAASGASNWHQPLLPFGSEPQLGAEVQLIAPDWLRKQNAIRINLTPQWDGLPERGFNAWYINYPSVLRITNNDVFRVAVQAFTARGWEDLGVAQPMFVSHSEIPRGQTLALVITDLPGQEIASNDPADWTSRLRLVLSGLDFLHQEYWQEIEKGNGFDSNGQARLNPPYTPQWSSLSIQYQSQYPVAPTQQYVLTPFGHHAASDDTETLAEPQLYLGFAGLQAGQKLSLYWKLNSPQPLDLNWQFLNVENRWQSLNAQVQDHTDGWFDSGLWSATLPDNASDQACRMPLGKIWLRAIASLPAGAASDDPVSSYPLLQGLRANAMTATLMNAATIAPDHFDQALAAGSIVQPVAAVVGLDGVEQPWPGQGGRAMETVTAFNLRVARHLSCRGRALRSEDIRMLLLEQFPEIFAVIMPDNSEKLVGEQRITIIAAPGHADNTDVLRPAFNRARLERMRQYLQQRTSPWVKLSLGNPEYLDAGVNFMVDLDPAVTPEFGLAQLIQELNQRYLPWASDSQAAINAGNQIDYYQLLATIQQQPWVTRVRDLTINGKKQSIVAGINQVLVPKWHRDT
jgi:hypothetical protein